MKLNPAKMEGVVVVVVVGPFSNVGSGDTLVLDEVELPPPERPRHSVGEALLKVSPVKEVRLVGIRGRAVSLVGPPPPECSPP